MKAGLPPALQQGLRQLRSAWAARDARERRLLLLAGWVLGLFVLWSVALQPALRTLRDAPARLDALDRDLQGMQALAADVSELRATPPLPRAQSSAALRAASERLGDKGRLAEQGERAVLTLNNASTEQLRAWLLEVRSAARARPVDVNLTQGGQGLSGTIVLALGAP